jgi:hypothetical protein
MGTQGTGNFNAGHIKKVEIELDSTMVGEALAKNPAFILAVAKAVRNQLLRDARQFGTLFRQWGGK